MLFVMIFLFLTIYIVALGNINRTPMTDSLTFFAQRKGNRLSVRKRVSVLVPVGASLDASFTHAFPIDFRKLMH